jgi:hypothetical protein
MSNQHVFISADQFRPDPYTQSRNAERTLNAAVVHADISRSYEEYLEIFDAFYADDVEGSSETMEAPIRGKAGVRSLVFGFLTLVRSCVASIAAISGADTANLFPCQQGQPFSRGGGDCDWSMLFPPSPVRS